MNIKSLLVLMDPKTLVAGLFPIILGTIYSLYTYGKADILVMFALILAIGLVQSATNMFNDYMDFKRGEDHEDKDDEKVLISGGVNPKILLLLIGLYILIALVIGIWIASESSWNILLVALIGGLIAFFYSTGPLPISYTPFGELTSGVTMGTGITATVVFIQSQQFSLQDIWMTIPTTLYIAYIMFTNNVCDLEKDLKAGRHTFPGYMGFEVSKIIWVLGSLILVVITGILVLMKIYPIWSLMTMLILLSYKTVFPMRLYSQNEFKKGKMMAIIGQIGAQYHILLIISFVVALI